MSGREFTILYTHQKTKKAKTWQDGVLKYGVQGSKACLYDDKKSKLDSLHIRPDQLIVGEQLESDRYLILIEEENTHNAGAKVDSVPPHSNENRGSTSAGEPRRNHAIQPQQPRFPLKRRRTGFTVPRQVAKRPCNDEERTTEEDHTSSNSGPVIINPRTTLSSPLFSTPFQTKQKQDFMNLYKKTSPSIGHKTETHDGHDFQNSSDGVEYGYQAACTSMSSKWNLSEQTGGHHINPSFEAASGELYSQQGTHKITQEHTSVRKSSWNAYAENSDGTVCTTISSDDERSREHVKTKRNAAEILALLGGKQKKMQDTLPNFRSTKDFNNQDQDERSSETVENDIHDCVDDGSYTNVNLISKPLFGGRAVSSKNGELECETTEKGNGAYWYNNATEQIQLESCLDLKNNKGSASAMDSGKSLNMYGGLRTDGTSDQKQGNTHSDQENYEGDELRNIDDPVCEAMQERKCFSLNDNCQKSFTDSDSNQVDELINTERNEELERTTSCLADSEDNTLQVACDESTGNFSQPSSVDTFDISLSSQLSQDCCLKRQISENNQICDSSSSRLQEVPYWGSMGPVLEVPRQLISKRNKEIQGFNADSGHQGTEEDLYETDHMNRDITREGKVVRDLEVVAVLSSSPLQNDEFKPDLDLLLHTESQSDDIPEQQSFASTEASHYLTGHSEFTASSQGYRTQDMPAVLRLVSNSSATDSKEMHSEATVNQLPTQEMITDFWQPHQIHVIDKMEDALQSQKNLSDAAAVQRQTQSGSFVISELPHPSELIGMRKKTSRDSLDKSLLEKASKKIEDSHWQRAVISGTVVRSLRSSTVVEREALENDCVADGDAVDLQNVHVPQEDDELFYIDLSSSKDSYSELPTQLWRSQQISNTSTSGISPRHPTGHNNSPIQRVPSVGSSLRDSPLCGDVWSPSQDVVPEYHNREEEDDLGSALIDATTSKQSSFGFKFGESQREGRVHRLNSDVQKQAHSDMLTVGDYDETSLIQTGCGNTPLSTQPNFIRNNIAMGCHDIETNSKQQGTLDQTVDRELADSSNFLLQDGIGTIYSEDQGIGKSGRVNTKFKFKCRERKPLITKPMEDDTGSSFQSGSDKINSPSVNLGAHQSIALKRILSRPTEGNNWNMPRQSVKCDTGLMNPAASIEHNAKRQLSESNRQRDETETQNLSYGNDEQYEQEHDEKSNQVSGQLSGRFDSGSMAGPVRKYRTGLKRISANPSGTVEQTGEMKSTVRKQTVGAFVSNRSYGKKRFHTPIVGSAQQSTLGDSKINLCGDLFFPSKKEVENIAVPVRQVTIPITFPNINVYKQTLIAALKEHLNIVLFDLAQRYHSGRAKADISHYMPNCGSFKGNQGTSVCNAASNVPVCEHGSVSKMVMVKKDGPNKGRFFYTCGAQRSQQCKFFQWADADSKSGGRGVVKKVTQFVLSDAQSIDSFYKSQNIALYCECRLVRKTSGDVYGPLKNAPAWIKKYRSQNSENVKKKLYLQLSRKEHSSVYSKDDLWIISKDLNFDPMSTFIAKSVYHGPSSSAEVEIEPISGYSPSNWINSDTNVYAILACNASNELSCIRNIQDYLNPRVTPIIPYLIHSPEDVPSNQVTGPSQNTFRCPVSTLTDSSCIDVPWHVVEKYAEDFIDKYNLNIDQSTALRRVAQMISGHENCFAPVTLVHGVFGAGKSFLLAVTIMFLVELFNLIGSEEDKANRWKILISSTTNVAVDRILLGLLDLGFEDFVRVGSMKKIAKPVLPYSVHATGSDNQELKELQDMLKGDLTPSEKQLVRKTIEKHRLGHNKAKLSNVKVVGVTCAACDFPCMQKLKFPVVLLDECSQMTESTSLLPMARFECEKLVLVGDPKQLNPTIQGSESAHQSGLEQTLFDRLTRMGHLATMLRTQYRCHPNISAIANDLFYENHLLNGVSADERLPLAEGFPTLCFYNVSNGKEVCGRDGSYYNEMEADFVVFLIETLVSNGVHPCNIGVITLYKAQLSRVSLQIQASNVGSQSELRAIQISTVDAFQGGEKSIIILSCVRTDYMGFIDCDKRTNVALTRSKNHLFIVGNMKMLYQNNLWGKVVSHCQEYKDGIQSSQIFMKKWREQREVDSQHSEQSEQDKTKQNMKQRKSRKRQIDDDYDDDGGDCSVEEDSLPMSLECRDLEDFDMDDHQSAKSMEKHSRWSQQSRLAEKHQHDPDGLQAPPKTDDFQDPGSYNDDRNCNIN